MTRLLLIALLLTAPFRSARCQGDADSFQSFSQTFDDLLDAVHQLRKKTNPMAYFRLSMPQYPEPLIFSPDGAGDAFFVVPVARIYPKALPAKELEEELARLRRPPLFAPSYDKQRRRLDWYAPKAIADLRRSLAPWLLKDHPIWSHIPNFEFAVARIPREHEAEFLDALLTGFLHTTRKDFKCSIGWN